MGRISNSIRVTLLVTALLIIVIGVAQAVELPPDFSAAFIQTSGPDAPITIGDFYASSQGENEPHFVRVNVPCTWPQDTPITFALFDPEVEEPDPPLSEPPPADDEIRDDSGTTISPPNLTFASTTTYTLITPVGASVGPVVFTPTLTNSTNGLWVELVTFTPATADFGCGVYSVGARTSGDDDNAWKLSVSHDPDCTVSTAGPGSCTGIGPGQSDLLSNGNEQDDTDGIEGTGDELIISLDQITYQHEGPDATCQIFFHPV